MAGSPVSSSRPAIGGEMATASKNQPAHDRPRVFATTPTTIAKPNQTTIASITLRASANFRAETTGLAY